MVKIIKVNYIGATVVSRRLKPCLPSPPWPRSRRCTCTCRNIDPVFANNRARRDDRLVIHDLDASVVVILVDRRVRTNQRTRATYTHRAVRLASLIPRNSLHARLVKFQKLLTLWLTLLLLDRLVIHRLVVFQLQARPERVRIHARSVIVFRQHTLNNRRRGRRGRATSTLAMPVVGW